MKVKYFPEQILALNYLSNRSPVIETLYGGGAGGGKSFLGQDWQINRRVKYPETRGFIGRNDLGDLRKFTVPETMEKLSDRGLIFGKEYKYNGQDMFIELYNGSRIYFIDLFAYPSDPDFQRFGSSAYTDGFIEEAAEITEKAKNIALSRIRYKLTEFCHKCGEHGLNKGLVTVIDDKDKPVEWLCKCGEVSSGLLPKLLMTCNPNPGFLRDKFFDPHTNGTLSEDKIFVKSLAKDNPHIPEQYINLLNDLPEADRKRLKDGDWYYDSSVDAMFQYLDLVAAFNDRTAAKTDPFYLTGDIARLGKDKTMLGVWHGLTLIEVVCLSKVRTPVVQEEMRRLMSKYDILLRNVIADEDGIGGGIVDNVGCRGFVNGSAPSDPKRFANLKHECYFKLADYIEKNKITFAVKSYKDSIVKELQAIRRKAPEGDTKLSINSKDEQKKILGHSPDIADMIMFRMFFEIKKNYGTYQIY